MISEYFFNKNLTIRIITFTIRFVSPLIIIYFSGFKEVAEYYNFFFYTTIIVTICGLELGTSYARLQKNQTSENPNVMVSMMLVNCLLVSIVIFPILLYFNFSLIIALLILVFISIETLINEYGRSLWNTYEANSAVALELARAIVTSLSVTLSITFTGLFLSIEFFIVYITLTLLLIIKFIKIELKLCYVEAKRYMQNLFDRRNFDDEQSKNRNYGFKLLIFLQAASIIHLGERLVIAQYTSIERLGSYLFVLSIVQGLTALIFTQRIAFVRKCFLQDPSFPNCQKTIHKMVYILGVQLLIFASLITFLISFCASGIEEVLSKSINFELWYLFAVPSVCTWQIFGSNTLPIRLNTNKSVIFYGILLALATITYIILYFTFDHINLTIFITIVVIVNLVLICDRFAGALYSK